jgi:hypothetical protein
MTRRNSTYYRAAAMTAPVPAPTPPTRSRSRATSVSRRSVSLHRDGQLEARQVEFRTGVMGDRSDPVFGRSVIVLDNNGNWLQFCALAK